MAKKHKTGKCEIHWGDGSDGIIHGIVSFDPLASEIDKDGIEVASAIISTSPEPQDAFDFYTSQGYKLNLITGEYYK